MRFAFVLLALALAGCGHKAFDSKLQNGLGTAGGDASLNARDAACPSLESQAPADCYGMFIRSKATLVSTGGSVEGTLGSDLVTGEEGADALSGEPLGALTGSADKILGKGGNDAVNGNRGNDVLYGGGGDDSIRGGKDND